MEAAGRGPEGGEGAAAASPHGGTDARLSCEGGRARGGPRLWDSSQK